MNTTRLNVRITEALADRLEEIRVLTGAASLTDVFRRAFACYEDLARTAVGGGRIVLHPKGEEPREITPVWPIPRSKSPDEHAL